MVFGRFYRHLDSAQKLNKSEGLGLGLYIADKIIREIKGTIQIEDNPKGKGSCFIAEIPVFKSPKKDRK